MMLILTLASGITPREGTGGGPSSGSKQLCGADLPQLWRGYCNDVAQAGCAWCVRLGQEASILYEAAVVMSSQGGRILARELLVYLEEDISGRLS